jgi:hypothetical protein
LSTDPIDDEKRSFLASLLQVLIDKLKWDPGDDPDELDDDDKAAFDGLRKVLLSAPFISSGLSKKPLGIADIHGFRAHDRSRSCDECSSYARTEYLVGVSTWRTHSME